MKKIMTAMLGLSLLVGTASFAFGQDNDKDKKETKKGGKKGGKKGDKKEDKKD